MLVGIDADKFPAPRHAVSVLGGGFAVALVWWWAEPPGSVPQWIGPVLAGLAAGLLLTALAEVVAGRVGRLPARRRAVVLPAVVTVTALIAAGGIGAVVRDPDRAEAGCDHPVELRILASPGNESTVRELVDAYERWTAEAAGGCPAVASYVYSVPADQAITGLQAGWSGALQEHGPRPDLWLPASAADIDTVREALAGTDSDLVRLDPLVIAATPLVVAVAEPAASPATDHRQQSLTWPGLAADTAGFGWQLVRPVPAVSEVGELVTVALYGRTPPGTDPVALARQTETRIARALNDGDYPLADTSVLLQRYRQLGEAASGTALLVTEQAVVRFNLDSLAGEAPTAGGTPAADQLVAFYPADPLTADLTAVTLSWLDPPAGPGPGAAGELRRWLSGENGQAALLATGLRPVGSPPSAGGPTFPIVPELGVLPDAMPPDQTYQPAGTAARERAQEVYAAAQRPGRVLLAVDASGSMDEPVDGARGPDGSPLTRFQVATLGVEAALQQLGDRDEFGLWAFGPPDSRELVPIGPATGQRSGGEREREQAAVEALAGLRPGGPTPLYRTILDGVSAAGGGDGDQVNALVVLTDGEDSEQDDPTVEALAEVGPGDPRVFVVAVGESSCRAEPLIDVTSGTGGECIPADFDTLATQLAELFGVLWSGGSSDD